MLAAAESHCRLSQAPTALSAAGARMEAMASRSPSAWRLAKAASPSSCSWPMMWACCRHLQRTHNILKLYRSAARLTPAWPGASRAACAVRKHPREEPA